MTSWLLDSTYIMPFFGIPVNIQHLKESLIHLLSSRKLSLFLTSCSLIEAKWKAIRNFIQTKNTEHLNRANKALESFRTNQYLTILNPWFERNASYWADDLLKNGHTDYMDCWIAGTARAKNYAFISEDKLLKKKIDSIETWKEFQMISWNEFLKAIE